MTDDERDTMYSPFEKAIAAQVRKEKRIFLTQGAVKTLEELLEDACKPATIN